ncbi:hypothetical protein GOL69_11840, partial [Sinorhizobium medicae]|nr:hypothetical protein [Sinorhizobium medicae]
MPHLHDGQGWHWPPCRNLGRLSPYPQIRDDIRLLSETRLVDLIVFHDALDIVARFLEGDALDPVDDLVVELPPKDRTCSGLRFRADELAWRLIP